ncbi:MULTISPECIES: GntR family transcriptional regulator [unclassified Microbacterium]|uniref:GntR family transcriptional regulator n=1 Tax=unclassified Microbacterium TaxID=2609290 RepID=UPI00214AC804|nr:MULTISPECIES: GntR family transcriptional regulator [unclassified Microbacterium]MCR2808281.1 GntR family transcriptional regulator [Microbacterium sp. zg.B185]WIM19264.1 GntR family transcriptional regulator [Microbacterium sp. zg-B185]
MRSSLPPLEPQGSVLGDEVYSLLGEAILDGRLSAGERLRDQELAGQLGVSRTPVREALQRLERTGLVEVFPNRYTRVSVPGERTHADTNEFFVYMMGNALLLALRRCSDEALAHSLEHADAIIAASRIDDHDGIMAATSRFLERIIADSENVVFLRVMREAELAIRRNLAGWHPFVQCPIQRTERYVEFRDAVASRDGIRAEAILRDLHGLA